jgi:hypothetical protein
MSEIHKKKLRQGPEGPAIWIDPEPPDDHTFNPVATTALLTFLRPRKHIRSLKKTRPRVREA